MKVVWPDWPQILKKITKKGDQTTSWSQKKKGFKNADSKKQTPNADLIDRLQNTGQISKKRPSENTSGGPR
jgi:hypothetical protein